MAPQPAFEYAATVVDVYDGDSIKGIVDLGFGIQHGNERAPTAFRIKGIDTPEMRGHERAAGTVVRDWLRKHIEGKRVVLRTYKGDKYGRWLCDVLVTIGEQNVPVSIADIMVTLGYAKRYDGGTKDPWTAEQCAELVATAADRAFG